MVSDKLAHERRQLKQSSRMIHGHGVVGQSDELRRIAAWCDAEGIEPDEYGEGEGLQAFEHKVAALLGCERGRYFPSGTMAQEIALRIWTDRAGNSDVGMHPTCHLELHEEHGYQHLHGLDAALIGPEDRPMLAADLKAIDVDLAAIVIELPTRENGGQLPPWDDLVDFVELARSRGAKLHLDGARLWEAATGYGKPFEEITALFDSVYVSFYKGVGALSGAMLLGPTDFIDEAAIWQRRHGGNLHSLLPNWASAAMRLDDQLARFPRYRDHAFKLAADLSRVDGISIIPDPPHVGMFHVELDIDSESAQEARDKIASERGLWLFGQVQERPGGGIRFEVAIGDAALKVDATEVASAFADLMESAQI